MGVARPAATGEKLGPYTRREQLRFVWYNFTCRASEDLHGPPGLIATAPDFSAGGALRVRLHPSYVDALSVPGGHSLLNWAELAFRYT